jgi:Na+-driven multidrug efflux pump
MVASVNAILMPFSSTAVAFFGAYYKLQSFLFMPMNGLGQAAIPIVGFSYGAKNSGRIKSAIRTVVPIAVGIALVATIVFEAVPQVLLGFFSPSDAMMNFGVPALRIIALTFVPASLTMVLGYSMSGLGNGLVHMTGTALRQLVIFVPLLYMFAKSFGVEHCWYAIWISEAVAVLFCIIATVHILKKKKIF